MARPEHLAELDRRARQRFEEAAAELRSNLEARLREVSEQLFAAVAEARADLPEALLDTEALAALDDERRREGERGALDALLESSVAFDRAATQGAVLEALLAGARRFAPRAAMLLTRQEGWLGWGASGFDSGADPVAGSRGGYDGEALTSLASGRSVVRAEGEAARRLAVELGLPAAESSCMVPLVLRDRIAAVLYVDRRADELDTPLAALQLLTSAAAARLELQPLSQRAYTPTLAPGAGAVGAGLALWSADAAATPAAATPAAATPAAAAVAAPEVAPAEERESSGFTFVSDEPEASVPALPEVEEELDSTDVSSLFTAGAAAPPAVETPAEVPPEPPAEDFSAEFVPVEKESPLMPRETVFEIAPGAESAPIEVAPEEPVDEIEPESEVSPEEVWQAEEGEATAYVGTYTPAAEPETVEEIGDTTSPIPADDEIDLSETRAIPSGTPPAPPPTPEPEVRSPAATMAFEPPTTPGPSAPAPSARIDPTEDATVRIDRPPPLATEDATVLIDRSRTVAAPAAPAAEEDTNERTAARAAKTTEVSVPPDVRGPGLAFTSSRGARATGDNALHDEARRLARLLISEIKLYNEEQVEEGRRNRDLYHRLKDDIDRSRQIYEERVHETVRESSDYFQQELVRSLAGGDSRALGV